MYNAQMIRTWNLLLRNARRGGYVIAGGQNGGQLVESPYLMHPVEAGHVGLYSEPVATLDFASLYPSLYRWARAGLSASAGVHFRDAVSTADSRHRGCCQQLLLNCSTNLPANLTHAPSDLRTTTPSINPITRCPPPLHPAGRTTCATPRCCTLPTCPSWSPHRCSSRPRAQPS
jgi:hypothetical protein